MLKLKYTEMIDIEKKSREKLEGIIRGIYKEPGESVSYNNVHYALDSIEKNGQFSTVHGITIKEVSEDCEYEYHCDDDEELKDMTKDTTNVVKVDGMDLIIKSKVITDYTVEGTGHIFEVVTSQEAAEITGLTESAIRKAIKSGRLVLGIDYRKAGRITLINKASLKIFEKSDN